MNCSWKRDFKMSCLLCECFEMKDEMIGGREAQEQLQFIDFGIISEASCYLRSFLIIKIDNIIDFI